MKKRKKIIERSEDDIKESYYMNNDCVLFVYSLLLRINILYLKWQILINWPV